MLKLSFDEKSLAKLRSFVNKDQSGEQYTPSLPQKNNFNYSDSNDSDFKKEPKNFDTLDLLNKKPDEDVSGGFEKEPKNFEGTLDVFLGGKHEEQEQQEVSGLGFDGKHEEPEQGVSGSIFDEKQEGALDIASTHNTISVSESVKLMQGGRPASEVESAFDDAVSFSRSTTNTYKALAVANNAGYAAGKSGSEISQAMDTVISSTEALTESNEELAHTAENTLSVFLTGCKNHPVALATAGTGVFVLGFFGFRVFQNLSQVQWLDVTTDRISSEVTRWSLERTGFLTFRWVKFTETVYHIEPGALTKILDLKK